MPTISRPAASYQPSPLSPRQIIRRWCSDYIDGYPSRRRTRTRQWLAARIREFRQWNGGRQWLRIIADSVSPPETVVHS